MKSRALFLLAGTLAVAGCSSQASAGTPTAARASQQAPTSTRPAPTPTRSSALHSTPKPGTTTVAVRTTSRSAYDAGQSALNHGNFKEAAKDFRAAIARHQGGANAYVGLGTAEIGLHDYSAAYRAYHTAASLEPLAADVQYRTAYAALYSADYHTAVQYASRYIRLKPNDGKGYHLRFLAYGGLLDRKNQLKDARQVARLQPRTLDAYNDLGIALGQNGQYKASEDAFTHAIALQPKNWQLYKNRGLVEYRNHQFTPALRDLKRARALATTQIDRSNLDAAIAFLQKQMHH